MTNTAKLRPLFFALVFTVAASLVPQLARAQAPGALPTAPAASRAAIGGYTAARASLPGENGSPLEPYLFLFILAGGGMSADCVIRDLSSDGARVRVDSGVPLAGGLGLLVIRDGVMFDAVLAWRKGDQAGLAFSGRHDIRAAGDPELAHVHALWVELAPR